MKIRPNNNWIWNLKKNRKNANEGGELIRHLEGHAASDTIGALKTRHFARVDARLVAHRQLMLFAAGVAQRRHCRPSPGSAPGSAPARRRPALIGRPVSRMSRLDCRHQQRQHHQHHYFCAHLSRFLSNSFIRISLLILF